MTEKASWNRIAAFIAAVTGTLPDGRRTGSGWLDLHKDKSKLNYAIERVLPQFSPLAEKVQRGLSAINLDHCATDAEGIILIDGQGNFRFTPAEQKKRNDEQATYLDEKCQEYEPFFVSLLPPGLSERDLQAFEDFVATKEVIAEYRIRVQAELPDADTAAAASEKDEEGRRAN